MRLCTVLSLTAAASIAAFGSASADETFAALDGITATVIAANEAAEIRGGVITIDFQSFAAEHPNYSGPVTGVLGLHQPQHDLVVVVGQGPVQ